METEILYNAVGKLNELDAFTFTLLGKEVGKGEQKADAVIQIRDTQKEWNYNAEIKSKIVPAQIQAIKNQMEGHQPYILIAEYITTPAKKILRENNIPYIDTAGNIFIKNEGIYIFIETQKTNRSKLYVGNRAFNKAGLKVVYQFLINPNFLNKPYRFIGKYAGVTIDTVGKVIQDLLREKYIIQVKQKEYQFLDKTKLFQDWVTAYNSTLRPKLKNKNYKFLDKGFRWKKLTLPNETYWGGAIAAEILTDHLIADKGLVYTGLPFEEVMKSLKIIPDPQGDITLVEKFWNNDQEGKNVHPILIYADLLKEPNPRYVEAANIIYKNYVEGQL